jgi:FPC/CPF motif-containing protein YcgG
MLEIQNKVLAHHKPDRVISLERAHDIKRLMAANDDITPTVIKNDMDSCFPFLVIEAKSEKGTVGFDSIERQTAFPIRAMLDIQKRLETAGSAQMSPLVWFLANRGDEWRVYGCVPRRARAVSFSKPSVMIRADFGHEADHRPMAWLHSSS